MSDVLFYLEQMWKAIRDKLEGYPAQLKVAKGLLELGLRVTTDGKIFCGPVEMSEGKIGRAFEVDRRAVNRTVDTILSDSDLKEIYGNIRPAGPFLKDIVEEFGFGLLEVRADPSRVGIIATASKIIAEEDISIRQIVADDPEIYPDPKLTIITDRPVPGEKLTKLLEISGVKEVTIS